MPQVKVLEKILNANDQLAGENRRRWAEKRRLVLNFVGGPGAGKTSVLEALLPRLAGDGTLGVIEGDIATTADADRIAVLGVPVVQINTDRFGGACHLEAQAIRGAEASLPADLRYLFIENVGNLVCPAEFDLGEAAKVGVLSVAEGEDKPLKYPLLFRVIDLLLITKVDLLPHLRVDEAKLLANVRTVNARVPVIRFSATTGEGLEALVEWVRARRPA